MKATKLPKNIDFSLLYTLFSIKAHAVPGTVTQEDASKIRVNPYQQRDSAPQEIHGTTPGGALEATVPTYSLHEQNMAQAATAVADAGSSKLQYHAGKQKVKFN